jgi:hypothetical protein
MARLAQNACHFGHRDRFRACGDKELTRSRLHSHGRHMQAGRVSGVDHAHAHIGDHWHLSASHIGHQGDARALKLRAK